MDPVEKIIVALDCSKLDEIDSVVEDLGDGPTYKVGLELITSVGGPQAVERLHSLGVRVFYDGKFADIPKTTARASAAASAMGVSMFTVHASSSTPSMQAASAHAGDSLALAVTVLSSMTEHEVVSIFSGGIDVAALKFAKHALEARMDGIVCSPLELEVITRRPGFSGMTFITPGIRPLWAETSGQTRRGTPTDAIRRGADYLVVGDPITHPPSGMSSFDALQRIADEVAQALPR